MTDPSAERHTGTVRRGSLRTPQRPPPDVRAGWIALVATLILGAGAVGWLLGSGGGRASGLEQTVGAGGVASGAATATRTAAEESPSPVAPDPTSEPTAEVTPRPTAEATTRPTPEPTPQPVGLVIDFPADGAIVHSRDINVIGTASPGATVTRDIPLWFDDHTTAGEDGLWMLPVELAEGENRLEFRVGDDPTTAQVLLVTYQPAP